MAIDPRKRLKQLERRKAKRNEKNKAVRREENQRIERKLAGASRFPILHCWMANTFEDNGIGNVLLSRALPGGMVAVASFLIDSYCLGVKDAMATIVSRPRYISEIVRKVASNQEMIPTEAADARKFVESAVDYAQSLGISPGPDYIAAREIFGSIDPTQSTREFVFGKNGKPYFIAGPHDTPARCRRILAALAESCGPGGYHYLLTVDSLHDSLLKSRPLLLDERTTIQRVEPVGNDDLEG